MAWEDQIQTRLMADTTLMAILTGGIYTAGQIGRDGINRDKAATANAFENTATSRKLKPCAFIAEAEKVYDDFIRDEIAKYASYRQRVRIHLYEDVGYTNIDLAEARIYTLLFGEPLTGSLPLTVINEVSRQREPGALLGASMHIVDYLVLAVKGA